MSDGVFHLAFIGPGGPEFLLVMLVLLVMFGAKDAPRILRKLNEVINHVRNTADSFKREVMYGDLHSETPSYTPSDAAGDEHDEDYDYDADYGDEIFQELEESDDQGEPEIAEGEEGDDRKD
jgi:Sec-independent protein translocase protein TatA